MPSRVDGFISNGNVPTFFLGPPEVNHAKSLLKDVERGRTGKDENKQLSLLLMVLNMPHIRALVCVFEETNHTCVASI